MRGAIYLSISIITEAIGTTLLKISDGFTAPVPTIGFAISYLAAFTFLSLSLKTIPLSSAYATWAGIGTALAVVIGIVLFQEEVSVLKIVALVLVVVGIMMLNKGKIDADPEPDTETSASSSNIA